MPEIELTRRRVLGGLITIGAASAAAGAGTFALFSDSETSEDNSVTAGTLNLSLNPNTGGATTSITVSQAKPGDSGYVAIGMENIGNIAGNIKGVNIGEVSGGTFSANLVTDSDGTNSEFEADPTTDSGELDDSLKVGVFIETNGDFNGSIGTSSTSTTSRSSNATNVISSDTTLSNALGENTVSESLSGSTNKVLVVNYEIPNTTSSQNEIQGDSVAFDVQVTLEQA